MDGSAVRTTFRREYALARGAKLGFWRTLKRAWFWWRLLNRHAVRGP